MKNKTVLLLMLASILWVSAAAQPNIKRQKAIGGDGNDQLNSMCRTIDGGVVLGGVSGSFISDDKSENSRGDDDYWIVKLDRLGNIQWDKTLGGDLRELFGEVQQTADGGYIVGGSTLSGQTGDKTEASRGMNDFWIVKLSSAGQIQWEKTFGGNKEDILYSIKPTADGGFVMGGSSNSGISGDKTADSRGGNDYWMVKVDAAGTKQWDKTIGGDNTDVLHSLVQTTDEGYFLCGYSDSYKSGEKSEDQINIDYWVVKLDKWGAIQWDNTIRGGLDDIPYSTQQTADGGYVVAGYSNSNAFADKTDASRGGNDYWVVKLSSTGAMEWNKTIGGNYGDQLFSIQQTSDKGYVLGGSSWSGIWGEKTEPRRGGNSADYWVVKLSKNGAVEWDKTIGGGTSDYGRSVLEALENVYIVAGYSLSGANKDKTVGSRGGYDYWILQINYRAQPPAASAESSSKKAGSTALQDNDNFRFFPNPAREQITVQTTGKAIFTLTNAQGKLISTQTINGTGILRVAYLPAGVYYLKNTATGAAKQVTVIK